MGRETRLTAWSSLWSLACCTVRKSDHTEGSEMTITKPDLANEWDKEKLRNWMRNAKRLKREDVYRRRIPPALSR